MGINHQQWGFWFTKNKKRCPKKNTRNGNPWTKRAFEWEKHMQMVDNSIVMIDFHRATMTYWVHGFISFISWDMGPYDHGFLYILLWLELRPRCNNYIVIQWSMSSESQPFPFWWLLGDNYQGIRKWECRHIATTLQVECWTPHAGTMIITTNLKHSPVELKKHKNRNALAMQIHVNLFQLHI